MKKKLRKKLTAIFVVLTLVITSISVNDLGNVFATSTYTNQYATINKNEFLFGYNAYTGSSKSEITVTSCDDKAEVVKYPTFEEICRALKLSQSNYCSDMLLTCIDKNNEYTTIEIPSGYPMIKSNFVQANDSVQSITIEENNDVTLKPYCFSLCDGLQKVSVSAPNNTVTIEEGAFCKLTALQEISITAKKIVIKKPFSDCSPKNLYLNGIVDVASNLEGTKLDTLSTAGNSSLPDGFLKNCTIENVSLSGTTTVNKAFSGCKITNLNMEGTSTVGSSAFSNCNITTMSINSKTVFGNKTLDNCTVKNLYFNLDNRNNCGNISYKGGNDRLGYHTTVENIFFNYANIHGQTDNVQELNAFPLGDDENTSLNCDNIYFYDANFKYIDIKGSAYKRTKEGKTNVYGWGGAMAWDVDGNRKSAYDMYKEWMNNDTCTFYNYVKNTNSGEASDVFELKVSEIYIPDDAQTVAYDFSNPDNIYAWANFESQNNQYAEKNDFVRANGYSMKPLTMNVDEAATTFATNFNYRILKKDDSVKGLSNEQYNYNYSSNNEQANGWYTALTTKEDNLTEGNNYYLIEVGGVKYPITIVAKYNKIEKLAIDKAELHLTIGETVTPDMIKVTATYTDGTTAELPDTAYEIEEHTIAEGANTVTVKAKTHAMSEEYVSEKITVTGYKDICTGFKASSEIKQLYEGGTLNVNDVVLTDVTYANPTKKDTSVTSGFKFLINGQESDTYTINTGVNSISIVYKGCTLENAITITGMVNTITKVEATYTGTVYEGMRVSTGSATLAIRIYENNKTEGTLLTDNTGVTLDAYTIVPGDNLINVYYKGIKSVTPITVTGISDYAVQITSAAYIGSLKVGYCPVSADIELQAVMASGRTVDTKLDSKLKEHIVIAEKTIETTTEMLTISFKSATYIIPVKANIVVPTMTVPTIVPTQSAIATTPEPLIPTATVSTPEAVTSATPIVTIEPTTIATSETPTKTPEATMAVVSTNAPTSVPQQTIAPSTTIDSTVAAENAKQLPVKGQVYTIAGIKYKVLSVNTDKANGTVSVVGYSSKKSIKIVTSVKIKGCQFKIISISKNAFKNCTKLKGTVVINGSISKIEKNAFYNCKNITKIIVGSKVKSIGSKSFYGCAKLKTVDLSKASALTNISPSAFKKNHKKRSFILEKKK